MADISDRDLDKDFRPNGRPQSTVARNFSAALDELFKIDGGIENAVLDVDKKKSAVSTQSRELEALEARLRETEARLQRANSHSRSSSPLHRPMQRRTPVRGTFDDPAAASGSNGAPTPTNDGLSPTTNGGEHYTTSPRSPLGRNRSWNASPISQELPTKPGATVPATTAMTSTPSKGPMIPKERPPGYVMVGRPIGPASGTNNQSDDDSDES